MKYLLSTVILLAFSISMHSCSPDKKVRKDASGGKTSEILVVAEKAIWEGLAGQTVKTFFTQEQEGLPQSEPMYNVVSIPENNFSKMFKKHRNILIIIIDPQQKEPVIEAKKDLWASPQVAFRIVVPSDKAFVRIFNENKERMLELFNKAERERIKRAFKKIREYKVSKVLEKDYGISMIIPEGFYIAKQEASLVWLRKEPAEYSQGILIYFMPYKNTLAFSNDRIISLRDSIARLYVPGPTENSFMSTSTEFIAPAFKKIDFNGNFAVETRGLWKVEGDFMGGPFVNYTFVDTLKNRLVTLDGYVYAPKHGKRDFLRQVESILYTIELNLEAKKQEDVKE